MPQERAFDAGETGSVKTMYGTFNNMAVVKQESPKNATLNKIGGNTDKGDTSSRGTMTVSKERHMSPKHFIF